MTLSVALLRSIYNEYNEKYFDNDLPYIQLKISQRLLHAVGRAKASGGWKCTPKSITISGMFDLNENQLRSVMCHEMIHIWQYKTYQMGGHNWDFTNKANEIERMGGPKITVRFDTNVLGELVGSDNLSNKSWEIVVWENKAENKVRFLKTKDHNVSRLIDLSVLHWSPIWELKGIYNVKDGRFTKFTSSRTLKWYNFPKDKFDDELADGLVLNRLVA